MNSINTYTEEELVSLLKSRDSKGFNYLYENYGRSLYTVIAQIIGDVSVANDVLQETFINIWTKIESFDPEKGRLFTWMLRIARNAAIDTVRSKSYHYTRNKIFISEETSANFKGGVTSDIDNIGLKKILHKLSDENRNLIELSYFMGYTHEQIAEVVKMPLGTVKSKIRNALSKLREYLK